jgi:hypothetical protein
MLIETLCGVPVLINRHHSFLDEANWASVGVKTITWVPDVDENDFCTGKSTANVVSPTPRLVKTFVISVLAVKLL